jgi:carboxyl-terminal processing protease
MRWILLVLFIGLMPVANAADFSKADFEKAVAAIKKNARVELSEGQIYQAALNGVLLELEKKNETTSVRPSDQANVILAPRSVSELKKDLEGKVSGVGLVIEFAPDKGQRYPFVKEVIQKSGAADAGVLKADEILKIEGRAVQDFPSFQDIVFALRGKEESSVNITVLRKGDVLMKKMTRKKIEWEPVETSFPQLNIAHIKIRYFNDKTNGLLKAALATAHEKKSSMLILDVRGCGGGSLEEGLSALNMFYKKGEVMLTVKSRAKDEVKKASADGSGQGRKAIVLVDKDSRSMCEAFAASLKGSGYASVIGEPTFGKATVETLFEMDSGYSAKFTVAQLFDGQGKTWQGVGVQPDIKVMASEGNSDAALQAAISFAQR